MSGAVGSTIHVPDDGKFEGRGEWEVSCSVTGEKMWTIVEVVGGFGKSTERNRPKVSNAMESASPLTETATGLGARVPSAWRLYRVSRFETPSTRLFP